MSETATVGQLWQLQSGSTNQPAVAPSAQTTFQFQDVPDRSPTGPLAYYLPGCLLTFSGNVVVAGSAGSVITSDQIAAALFSNLAWIQAWQGTAVSSQHVLGSQYYVTEFTLNGLRPSSMPRTIAGAGAGTYPFEITYFVPFNSARIGNLGHDTSQLALLARASQLQINAAPAAALTALSTGATFTNLKARCSAILDPRQELVLGTPIETILTQIVAGSGNSVKITNFGTDTGLQGTDPGGGVLALHFLTSVNSQGGSFASANITDFVWQWRGQAYTQDILGLLSQWKRLLENPFTTGEIASTLAGYPPTQGFPYAMQNPNVNPAAAAQVELGNLLTWPLVLNGKRVRLTSLQTADSDQTFNMTIAGGYAGTHQILGMYARSWQKAMRAGWKAQVMAGGGGSLAAHVLGPTYGAARVARRGSQGHAFTTADQSRYLPWQLYPSEVLPAGVGE